MMNLIREAYCVFLIICVTVAYQQKDDSAVKYITVKNIDPLEYSLEHSVSEPFIAFATFTDSETHVSNFGQLFVETNGTFNDEHQGFAAGFAEGYLTAERTYQHSYNMMCQVDCSGIAPPEVERFFEEQNAWIRSEIALKKDTDAMWSFMSFLVHQFDGLVAGYKASDFGKKNPLDLWAFTMVNAMGDLFDIIPATSVSRRPNFHTMDVAAARDYRRRNGHCSALIRTADDLSDIFVGHTSWFTYSAMLRIYKTYKFPLANKERKSATISFSSYPGTLSSLDDLYILGEAEMVMTQTTNSIFNSSLWDLVQPKSLLAWHRVRAANQLTDSGPAWYDMVSRYNSGTYNNQYMVLDTKRFKANNALQSNTLFVVEQIPGLMAGADVTEQLERGYWSSYNVPYHKSIYERSGYLRLDDLSKKLPYSQYQVDERGEIFRRDQSFVKDLASLQTLMRSNNFQTDPLSGNDPWNAICARGDLAYYAGGGYDTKVTATSLLKDSAGQLLMGANIINGPTSQGQVAFTWSTCGFTDRHLGQPDTFEFEFESVSLQSMQH